MNWHNRTINGEPETVSADERFRIVWGGRLAKPGVSYRMYDATTKTFYRGFLNAGNAQNLAEAITTGTVHTVGLVACCGAKLHRPAMARNLYRSPLFRKAAFYAETHYHEWFILSALYGVVRPDDVIEPYDRTLKDMNHANRRVWALLVGSQLDQFTRFGARRLPGGSNALRYSALFAMHAGQDYCAPLIDTIPMTYPVKGLGIGKQLAFYTKDAGS